MRSVWKIVSVSAIFGLSACAGKVDYTPPAPPSQFENSVVIDQPQLAVWQRIVKNLSRDFYVINNIDKDSGLINISYSSNPEDIIDCGRIRSYVKNARGERTYDFPAAKAAQSYEVMDMQYGNGLLFIDRRVAVEGRANVIVQPVDQNHTSVSVSAKYIVTKTFVARNTAPNSIPLSQTDTISFNSGGSATFPGNLPSTCRSTGKLEGDVIAAARG
jgi:hypothetical protein